VAERLCYLERWADGLTRLSLSDLENLDLTQLVGLADLEFLDVQGSHVHNLSALVSRNGLAFISSFIEKSLDLRECDLPEKVRSIT